MVLASEAAFAWLTAQRREPALPSSRELVTVKVAGTRRSSSASTAGRNRCGALRIGRVTWRLNTLRIQERTDMGTSGDRREHARKPAAPRAAGVKGQQSHAGPTARTVAA